MVKDNDGVALKRLIQLAESQDENISF